MRDTVPGVDEPGTIDPGVVPGDALDGSDDSAPVGFGPFDNGDADGGVDPGENAVGLEEGSVSALAPADVTVPEVVGEDVGLWPGVAGDDGEEDGAGDGGGGAGSSKL